MTFDVIIIGGTVYDGTGSPPRRADVGITGQTIESVEDLTGASAHRVIDATGMAVSPGFIDTHTHSEGALLVDPQHACAVRQGITTVITGLDGMSFAPLSEANHRAYRRYLGGILGPCVDGLDMSSIEAFRRHYQKVAVNVAYLLPLGAVRLETVGFHDRPLDRNALTKARYIIREAHEQGVVGFSVGAAYHPGAWATTDELIELCRTVAESGGVYVNEPRIVELDRVEGRDGVVEGLTISQQSGVRLHFAHHRTRPHNAGCVEAFMAPIDEAKSRGLDVSADIYPYAAGSSIPISYLAGIDQEGGPDAIVQRLADPAQRAAVAARIERDPIGPLHEMVFTYLPGHKDLEGMSLLDVARRRRVSPGELICDMLLEEDLKVGYLSAPTISTALWRQVGLDALSLLARPDYMACSDITPCGSMPHPRCFGAFPRFLGRLRRQHGFPSLELMVQRMTDNPARRFGLERRGRIAKGHFADAVVFDPDRVIDTATYDDPCQFPAGIPFVLVNGRIAVDEERCTGEWAGQAVP